MKHNTAAHKSVPRGQAGSGPQCLWIVDIEPEKAHIYRATSSGTEWVADATVDRTRMCVTGEECGDLQGEFKCADYMFVDNLVSWLERAEKKKAFDKLVLMGTPGVLDDVQARLGDKLCGCLHGTAGKGDGAPEDAVEDVLTEKMWF